MATGLAAGATSGAAILGVRVIDPSRLAFRNSPSGTRLSTRSRPQAALRLRVACEALDDTGQPYMVREISAEGIIEAARRLGERDPVRLVKAALPWLNRKPD